MKHHTIILVPHARARFRKWRVTNRQLMVAGALLVLFTAASIFTTFSFFTNTVDRQQLASIEAENQSLREINNSFEDSIRSLEQQLGEFEERTRQLAIVAGLEELSGGAEAGVGGTVLSPEPATLGSLTERSGLLTTELSRIDQKLADRQQWIASTPAISPVRGILTSGYGLRSDPITGRRSFHDGVDIATAPGRPVRAAADGVVIRAGRMSGLGNAVYLSHGYGLTTRYGHLSKITVEAGTRVRQGDTVGLVGSTGRATGYHVHYEVRKEGRSVNPIAYILDRPSVGS